ncbi:phage tail protein [Sphingobium abikonense]|uniref:phage tail protein n=1 Tax=Sphingobium abikonense TaxID=86193 RepID=UPI0007881F15|nr:phage tail protein [Sphingobium abikonense]
MATIVLSAVGTVLGGPIGGAIGGLIGNAFDNEVLFKPKGRQGARLSDLQVQTSSYGTQLPAIFGTMRVAGTVIWATDLQETSSRSGGGKGRPSVTSYSYSASIAVALSSRPIRAIRRIWADGNLLRGAAGDFKTELGAFRVHQGDEGQSPDPLIASAQGIGATPAHRGLAYVVFEDLALADYGNRIPSLTFEVEADEGAVSLGRIAGELSGARLAGPASISVDGFAASGADMREAVMPLVEAFGLGLRSGADGLALVDAGAAAGTIADEALAQRVNGRAIDPVEHQGGSADGVPVALSLRYHDAARDYQAGMQRVTRPGAGRSESGIDLPAVLDPDAARALASDRLRARWAGRARMTVRCDWRALGLAAGDVVTVDRAAGLWRIEEREWEAMAVRLALRRLPGGGGAPPIGAGSGAIVRPVDAPHGPTTLLLADLPRIADGVASAPLVVAAASGGAGWRNAALFVTGASGEAVPIGRSAGRAVMGVADTVLPGGSALLVDRGQSVSVTLLAADMVLLSVDEAALDQGRNLALLGRELIQFDTAERTGAATYRLSGLRRGVRGTDWAMAEHMAGEPFLLIEEGRLVEPLSMQGADSEAGSVLRVSAVGIGDVAPAEAMLTISGEALKPLAPVHMRAGRDGAGGWTIEWTRRSRDGWRWLSGTDVPLGEESERYGVEVLDGAIVVRAQEVTSASWTYGADMIAADGMDGRDVLIAVRQRGTYAIGRGASLMLTL